MSSSSFESPRVGVIAIVATLIAVGGTTLAVMEGPVPAPEFQSCYSKETGIWRNEDAKPGDISQIQVETHCEDNRLVHRARTLTKCSPRDCTWGWTPGIRGNNGHLFATFTTYSAHRSVVMNVYDIHMEASLKNDFHDTRRPDQSARYMLTRID